ncbi:MAG: hypothetical protein ACI81L_000699 [Verrucomicrobiales bacterium]|jgi:hypothetical protein
MNARRNSAVLLFVLPAWLLTVSSDNISGSLAESDCSVSVFDNSFTSELNTAAPDLVVTASVFDTRTNCWYELHPENRLTTASAIKLQVLSANLLKNQRQGSELSATLTNYAERMLWFSHNSPPTSVLYGRVGTEGMRDYSELVGATDTTHSSTYGITRASARDLTLVALSTIDANYPGPLTQENRALARQLLSGVHPSQRWGISAGLPSGWTSFLKNGFYPCSSSNCAPFAGEYTWRVASTGYNEAPGAMRGYGISILTDGAKSQMEGVEAVELISRHVAAHLSEGESTDRVFDTANCTQVVRGESSTNIAGRLGLSSTDWAEILSTSGGAGPLSGQLMCGDEPRAKTQQCICPARPLAIVS